VGRSLTSRVKHKVKNNLPSSEKLSGKAGGSLPLEMLYMAVKTLVMLDHGGFPVAISIQVHPTDQISAGRP